MQIALVNKYARVTGGADLHCLELARGLRDRGHEVAFLSTADGENLDQQGVFVPATVTNATRAGVRGGKAAQVAGRAIWNARVAIAAKELFSDFRPDVVHVHKLYPQLSVAPVVVAATRGIPVIQTVHDYEFISASHSDHTGRWIDYDETGRAYRVLNTALFGIKRLVHTRRINKWISVSRSTGDVYKRNGIQTRVLPNFTEQADFDLPQVGNRDGVLFIGRLSEEKGLLHVLKLTEYLRDLPIIIAGDGPLAGEVQHAAERFPNLTYLGRLSREMVSRQLASARLVVMPSLWREPGPLASLEAMAVGTPIVAYDNGGLAEYVMDAGAGVVVPPSAKRLAEAISALYDDRGRWEDMSHSGSAAVREVHTRDKYLNELEDLYVEAANEDRN